MGRLKVNFRIGLAHPLTLLYPLPESPASVTFLDTGNTVHIAVPQVTATRQEGRLGAFGELVLHVERECTHEEGQDATFANCRKLGIPADAARALWRFFESVRYAEFQKNSHIAGYPVAPAEEIQDNPLVRTCDVEWVYERGEPQYLALGGVPTITISHDSWTEATRRLAEDQPIPAHLSFALDAAYFVKGDPLRGIIMACAAWETALRYYLANVAAQRDPAYLVASRGGNIPRLYEFVRAAKGGQLFNQWAGKGSDTFYERERECIRRLPEWRNKLLHEGEATIPECTATEAVFAVLNAIDWLFGDGPDTGKTG